MSVGNIARTYAAVGDIANAIVYQRRADAILEKQLALNLAVGSERQKLLFVNGVGRRAPIGRFRCTSSRRPTTPTPSALAALVLLQRKGRVLDAMADTFAAARRRVADAGDQAAARSSEVGDRASCAAGVEHRRSGAREPSANSRSRSSRRRRNSSKPSSARTARSSARRCSRSRSRRCRRRSRSTAALLEFAIFRPFDPTAERNAEAYGPPHYAAYVMRRQTAPRGIDLGPAAAIDEAVEGLRKALRDPAPGRRRRQRARALDARVLQPLRAVVRRRDAAADLARRRAEPGAVRGARRRQAAVSDRALRDQLPDERPRSAADAGRSRRQRRGR